jgi:hypothetical protein
MFRAVTNVFFKRPPFPPHHCEMVLRVERRPARPALAALLLPNVQHRSKQFEVSQFTPARTAYNTAQRPCCVGIKVQVHDSD